MSAKPEAKGVVSKKTSPKKTRKVSNKPQKRVTRSSVTEDDQECSPDAESVVPELEESPPPSIVNSTPVRGSLKLNSNSISNEENASNDAKTDEDDETNYNDVDNDIAEIMAEFTAEDLKVPVEEITLDDEPVKINETVTSKLKSEDVTVLDNKTSTGEEPKSERTTVNNCEKVNKEIDGESVIEEINEATVKEEVTVNQENHEDKENSKSKCEENEEPAQDTEMVSEDELPAESKEPLETEAVSDEELPESGREAADLPETEAVSEDELPLESEKRKKKKVSAQAETEAVSEDELPEDAERKKESNLKSEPTDPKTDTEEHKKTENLKRKLPEGEYDPSSPTSENSQDDAPSAKRVALTDGKTTASKVVVKKSLPELEKYWKTVRDDPSDFTGWTYLLQYVDQENDIDAAREAYDAFLSHYPYCYGYWRKYADYEKRKGNVLKCEEVFDRGLKAIPLSVDLWLHYLNYCKTAFAEDEDRLRCQFDRAVQACGLEFRSDRLWESYIKWETEKKNLTNITALYDRLLSTPTQGYTTHFDNFQVHVSENPPQKILPVDDFLEIRREVLQILKQYDTPTAAVAAGEEAPPGAETDSLDDKGESVAVSTRMDEETTALRERIISSRRKVHKSTVSAVAARWNFEEGIKRPYFHVKPLERCQLKNWKEYLDYETEQGDKDRIITLYERCLIACALYEEFWIRFIRYLERVPEDMNDKIRDVYQRACLIHHKKKPNLHLHWAIFEESKGNFDQASEVLSNLEKSVPNLLQVAYRRINLERRRGDFDKVTELYDYYLSNNKSKSVMTNMTVKFARFTWKLKNDVEKAIAILKKALEKDKDNTRLYLQLIDMGLQKNPVDEDGIIAVFDQFLAKEGEPEQKLMFSQRKIEFLEDFGSNISSVQKAHDEYQKYLKQVRDRKKKESEQHKEIPQTTHSIQPHAKKIKTESSSFAASQPPPLVQTSSTAPTTALASSYPQQSYSQGYAAPYQQGQYPPGYNYNQYNQTGDANYNNYQNWQNYPQGNYGNYGQASWGSYYGNY